MEFIANHEGNNNAHCQIMNLVQDRTIWGSAVRDIVWLRSQDMTDDE